MDVLDMATTIGELIVAKLEEHITVQPTLTLAEAGRVLGVSSETVRGWCSSGKIPYIKVDKFYRIKPKDLNNFLNKNTKTGE